MCTPLFRETNFVKSQMYENKNASLEKVSPRYNFQATFSFLMTVIIFS